MFSKHPYIDLLMKLPHNQFSWYKSLKGELNYELDYYTG